MQIQNILLLTLLITFNGLTQADTIRLSDPVASDETSETFGAPQEDSLNSVSLKELLASPSGYLNDPFAITTRVAKVCKKKGCFLIAQEDTHVIRVAFKDYGFFVPTDIDNRTVTIVGNLIATERTKKQAKHFSGDIGENDALKSGPVYEIMATSVRVPRS